VFVIPILALSREDSRSEFSLMSKSSHIRRG
jgi:hypothetical protein